MAKMSPLMIAPPVIFAALAGLFWAGMGRENPDMLPSALKGKMAPVLELSQFDTVKVPTDDDLRAPGVKLVNYWASWCAPCRVEHPQLMELADEGIPIYGINYKDTPAKGQKFLNDMGDPFAEVGSDLEGRTALEWGVYGVPETYVIDSDGKIIERFAGPITQRVLKETIRPAIEAASPPTN